MLGAHLLSLRMPPIHNACHQHRFPLYDFSRKYLIVRVVRLTRTNMQITPVRTLNCHSQGRSPELYAFWKTARFQFLKLRRDSCSALLADV